MMKGMNEKTNGLNRTVFAQKKEADSINKLKLIVNLVLLELPIKKNESTSM